jgi:L-2-hydroxyglutarate oxidase
MDRARTNGVPGLELLDAAGLGAREPHVTGVAGLLVPGAAAIDFGVVARVIARQLMDHGSTVRTAAPVVDIGADGSRIVAETTAGEWEGRFLINCAGLQSDRVARLAGAVLAVRIVPFRGEYQELVPERRHLVNGMVYPVPDPRFPFLGTHFTPTVDRRVEVGPNAVPALAREGYSWGAVRPDELWSSWGHRGALRLAGRHWWTGLGEVYRSISLRGFVRRLQRLVPEITGDDLVPAGTGVRAQAVDARGRLVDDFAIVPAARSLHVLNAPSPAATAAFAIGERLADDALAAMDVH